jgi:hypothetical protein
LSDALPSVQEAGWASATGSRASAVGAVAFASVRLRALDKLPQAICRNNRERHGPTASLHQEALTSRRPDALMPVLLKGGSRGTVRGCSHRERKHYMSRKIKALGLALVAALALTAVMASAASAQFTSNKEHTIIKGTQEGSHVFTAGEGFGGISCSVATFAGTATTKNDADQTITPTYSGCKDSFGRTVDVDNTGLTYTFTANTNVGGTSDVHVSGGMTLTVTNGSGTVICTVVIKSPQTDNGITYDNLGGTNGVRTTTNATNVISTTSGGALNCGVSNGEHKTGKYTGTTIVKGETTTGEAAEINVDVA